MTTSRALAAVLAAVGVATAMTFGAPYALGEPEPVPGDPGVVDAPAVDGAPLPVGAPVDVAALPAPGAPVPEAVPAAEPAVPGATATYVGPAPFLPPTFDPPNGEAVGVGAPIMINFQRPIMNKPLAESAITITSEPPRAGHFYWENDQQLRWRPETFWAPNSVVTVDAAGIKSSFTTRDALVAVIDNSTHEMVITRNDVVLQTMPVSLGKTGDETANGTYYAIEKFADMWMDSSTYGVPIDEEEGYRIKVLDAVRISNTGIFVHGAPWSTWAQGNTNVSHGCVNVSASNAQWFFDNFNYGDPVIVKNSVGTYNQRDGRDDWQR
ncbi:MAG: L,D-transpeptidase family protein [Mycobacterium sp.]